MTVCIAALMNWFYGPDDIGRAAIVASDKMLTLGDVEYEPPDMKICFIGKSAMILVAGEMPAHSEALFDAQMEIKNSPTENIEEIANIYASKFKQIKIKRASTKYLEPLGLNYREFIKNQSVMSQSIVYEIVDQLQSYDLNVEALVVGCDFKDQAHIFLIDGEGLVTRQDDVGFAAIGIGGAQAKAQFMASRYPRLINYYNALPIVYMAKRRAEVAPGVGKDTDFFIVTRNGCTRIESYAIDVLAKAYDDIGKSLKDILVATSEKLESIYLKNSNNNPLIDIETDNKIDDQ